MYGTSKSFICGGAYIKPSWVVTVAVCLRNFTAMFVPIDRGAAECRMGISGGDANSLSAVQAIKSRSTHTHPKFVTTGVEMSMQTNVGLVLLEKPFELSPKVATIEIAAPGLDYVGKVITIAGYSSILLLYMMTQGKSELPADTLKLRSRTGTAWEKAKCKAEIGMADHFCIGDSDDGPWEYDIGGPAIYNKQLIGISVTNAAPQNIDSCGIYQDVIVYKEWIDEVLSSNLEGKMSSFIQRTRAIPVVVYLNLAVACLMKFILNN